MVENIQHFGPNIVSFQLVTEERQYYIIGCYLAPKDTLIIESIVTSLKERPKGSKMLVAGDSNANLYQPEGDWREEDIVAALTAVGLEDMLYHFLPL